MSGKTTGLAPKKAKLLLLLGLIASLNLGVSKLDCCSNPEDGTPEPSVISYRISHSPATLELEPGESGTFQITVTCEGSPDCISKFLPWERPGGSFQLLDWAVTAPGSASTAVVVTARKFPTELRLSQDPFTRNVTGGYVPITQSRRADLTIYQRSRPPLSKLSGGYLPVSVLISGDLPEEPPIEKKGPELYPYCSYFPDTVVGGRSRSIIDLNNWGGEDLAIVRFSISPGANTAAGEFSFPSGTPLPPFVIGAGEGTILAIDFAPTTVGSKSATLAITSNARGLVQSATCEATAKPPG